MADIGLVIQCVTRQFKYHQGRTIIFFRWEGWVTPKNIPTRQKLLEKIVQGKPSGKNRTSALQVRILKLKITVVQTIAQRKKIVHNLKANKQIREPENRPFPHPLKKKLWSISYDNPNVLINSFNFSVSKFPARPILDRLKTC